jgi:hypothetical protein
MLMTSLLQRIAVTFLIVATTCAPIFAQDTPATTREQLDKLLEAYKAYGLPLPPADAKLVRYRYQGSWTTAEGKKPAPVHGLAFLLKAATQDEKAELLNWFWRGFASSNEKLEIVEPNAAVLTRIDSPSAGLILAIQCHSLGWDELAGALLQRERKNRDAPAEIRLAQEAWDFWTEDLSSPKVDWSKLAPRLRILLEREPRSFQAFHRALLHSMELALKPSNAKPGSIEAQLDDLITTSEKPFEGHPQFLKIGLQGFAAVPTLIAHLNDDRLTRIQLEGKTSAAPGYQYRVRHFVSDLLQAIAGNDLGRDSLHKLGGLAVERARAEAWWQEANRVGEESYLLKHVVGESDDAEWPKVFLLQIIVQKYPQHLESLYRKTLAERPKMDDWPIADAVMASTLTKEKKREIFLAAAASKDMNRRCTALAHLRTLDRDRFHAILLASMKEAIESPDESSLSPAHLVLRTTDAELWAALLKLLRCMDPGYRLDFMDEMQSDDEPEVAAKQKLEFLAHFLEDAERGRSHWRGYGALAVRNNAARVIASILKIQADPQPDWTDSQWADLRAKVKAALERAGIK